MKHSPKEKVRRRHAAKVCRFCKHPLTMHKAGGCQGVIFLGGGHRRGCNCIDQASEKRHVDDPWEF